MLLCWMSFMSVTLESDLVLALLKRLQIIRPELRIVVMSATLDSGSCCEYPWRLPNFAIRGKAVRNLCQPSALFAGPAGSAG